MKLLVDTFLTKLQKPKYRRLLIAVLPPLLVLGLAMVIVPFVRGIDAGPNTAPSSISEANVSPAPLVATPSPTPSPTPKPEESPAPEAVKTVLFVNVSGENLYITVCDEYSAAINDVEFPLKLIYPDGETHQYSTETDGCLRILSLTPGDYQISMLSVEGYASAEPVTCTVAAKRAYTPIVNLREQTEVKTVSELPVEEVKPVQVEEAPPVVVEEIETPPSAEEMIVSEDESVVVVGEEESRDTAPQVETIVSLEVTGSTEEGPSMALVRTTTVLDANGNPTYTYQYATGENGMLLLTETGEESDVLPVEENGKLAYGLRRISTVFRTDEAGTYPVEDGQVPEEPEEGVSYYIEESSETVTLLNWDNTPVATYQITANPVSETVSIPVGWQSEDGKLYYCDNEGKKVTGLKKIDGKYYYFNDYGVKARSLGIDVSYFNGAIDWSAVKAQGIDFVIIRVAGRTWGKGVLFEDGNSYKQMENGGRYLQEARAAGLKIGAYVYSCAVNTDEAVEEASLALEILNGTALDLPLYIDMEYSGEYPNGRADQLSAQERTDIVEAFCTTVAGAGYSPGVYAGQYYYNEAINFSALSPYNIWLASYTREYRLPSFSGRYNVWQFTSSGSVNGIHGNVDMDVIF